MDQQQLKAVFQKWADHLGSGQLEDFYAMMDEEIIIFDEDLPWRLTKKDFIEHIGFHVLIGTLSNGLKASILLPKYGWNRIWICHFSRQTKRRGFRQRFWGYSNLDRCRRW